MTDERELQRIARSIVAEAAGRPDPDTYIAEAVVAAAAQFAEDDNYPADAVAVMLRQVHKLRLH